MPIPRQLLRLSTALHGPPLFGPVALWLGIQLLVLSLAALKTPYSLHFPAPEERLALEEMLVVQIAASAMLFPLLLRNFQTAAVVIISSWPLTLLAGILSAQLLPMKIAASGVVVSGWLAGLGGWLYVLRGQRACLVGVAVATGLALGGPLLWYLRAEFNSGPTELVWAQDGKLGPLMAALGVCDGRPRLPAAWEFMATFLLITLAAVIRRFWISHRQNHPRINPPPP